MGGKRKFHCAVVIHVFPKKTPVDAVMMGCVQNTLFWCVLLNRPQDVEADTSWEERMVQRQIIYVSIQLQAVQNQVAYVVTKSPPFTRSAPLLCSLHFLPVKFRVLFKFSLLTYKTLHEKQPVYLHSMLAPLLPSCSLRSSKGMSLSVPRV